MENTLQERRSNKGITEMYEKLTINIGVDEAGRGPLIGDLVIVGVLVRNDVLRELESSGLVESKQLSSESRLKFYMEAIKNKIVVVAVYVPSWEIDRENLNRLEEKYILWIINILRKIIGDIKEAEIKIYIDEVKGIAKRIESFVKQVFGRVAIDYKMEPHADSKYSSVALASVFAKVMRDRNLLALKKLYGDFGSGYSSDPRTVDWITRNYKPEFNPPLFLRRSWKNLRDIAPKWYKEKKKESRRQKSLLDYAKRCKNAN